MDKPGLNELMVQFGVDEATRLAVEPLLSERHCIQLVVNQEGATKVGESKIGGLPDLPDSLAWPNNGVVCEFLCQINLSEVPSSSVKDNLPAEGILYFFLEEYADSAIVLFHAGPVSEVKAISHKEVPHQIEIPASSRITFTTRRDWVLPRYDTVEFRKLNLSEEQNYAYEDFEYEIDSSPSIKVFFEGNSLLNEPTPASEIATSSRVEMAGSSAWHTLLTLDPFENEVTSRSALSRFQGMGRRHFFMIKKDDLKNGKFDNVPVLIGET